MKARTKLIIVAAVALVVCLAFYFFFVKSRRSELADVKTQVEAAEAETAQLQIELQQLQQLQENAPELEAELQRIRQFVPSEHEVPNFIFQVQEAADESGVDFVQISPELPKSPAEDPSGTSLAQVRVSIGANGGYFAVQDFMRRLYELDRALRIDTMTVATGAEGEAETAESATGTLTVLMTARIFFELPGGTVPGATGTVPAPAETTPAPTETDPAATPDATAPADPNATASPAGGTEEENQ